MSANVRTLLRVQFFMVWRRFRDGLGGGRARWGLLLLPLAALPLVVVVFAVSTAYLSLYVAGSALGHAEMLLTIALTAGQLVCLSLGVFYILSAFYYANDLRILVPLPIRPGEIILTKFIGIMAGEYLTMAPLVLPALAVYGVMADVGPLYVPFAAIIFILLPVMPLVLASLFSLVLMRITTPRRHRDMWRVAGALLGVAIGVGFQYLTRFTGPHVGPGASAELIQQALEQHRALIESAGRYFPASVWATAALREGAAGLGFPALLLFLGATAAALAGMYLAAERLFLGGLVGGDETRGSGKVLTAAELARETTRVRSPLWALLQREVRLLNRTPSFLMGGLLPVVVLPFILAIPVLQGREKLGELVAAAQQLAGSSLVPIVGMGAILLMTAMSNLAVTSISREGRHFWISRSIPVAPGLQIHAKLLHSLLFTLVHLTMVLGSLSILGLLTPAGAIAVVAGGLAVSAALGYGGLLIDLLRPNLKWTDPQQAMKGNANGLFNLILAVVAGALGAGIGFVLIQSATGLAPAGLTVAAAMAAAALGKAASALADRRYAEYED